MSVEVSAICNAGDRYIPLWLLMLTAISFTFSHFDSSSHDGVVDVASFAAVSVPPVGSLAVLVSSKTMVTPSSFSSSVLVWPAAAAFSFLEAACLALYSSLALNEPRMAVMMEQMRKAATVQMRTHVGFAESVLHSPIVIEGAFSLQKRVDALLWSLLLLLFTLISKTLINKMLTIC